MGAASSRRFIFHAPWRFPRQPELLVDDAGLDRKHLYSLLHKYELVKSSDDSGD